MWFAASTRPERRRETRTPGEGWVASAAILVSSRFPIGSRGGPGADLFGADLTNIIYNQATR